MDHGCRREKELTSLAPSWLRWTPLAPNVMERDGMLLPVNVCIFEGILRSIALLIVFFDCCDLSILQNQFSLENYALK